MHALLLIRFVPIGCLSALTAYEVPPAMPNSPKGGYEIDVYRIEPDGTLGERIACAKDFGCVDGTANTAEVTLPAGVTCEKCLVRLTRQALEWGGNYLFHSCAMVSISEDVDLCQGCSGHGTCVEVGPFTTACRVFAWTPLRL